MDLEKWTTRIKNITIAELWILTIILLLDIIFILKYFSTMIIISVGYFKTLDLSIIDYIDNKSPLFWISFISMLLSVLIGIIFIVISMINGSNIIAKETDIKEISNFLLNKKLNINYY